MSSKADLVIGIFLLAIVFPGGVWVIWRDIRNGKTTLTRGPNLRDMDVSRKQSASFYWFMIGIYAFGTLLALYLGLSSLIDFIKH